MSDKKVEFKEEHMEGVAGGLGVNTTVDTKVKTNRSGNKTDTKTADKKIAKLRPKKAMLRIELLAQATKAFNKAVQMPSATAPKLKCSKKFNLA